MNERYSLQLRFLFLFLFLFFGLFDKLNQCFVQKLQSIPIHKDWDFIFL
jgi:hypothetical protein